jgi:endonuclease YncB( thermonuclease family)
MGRVTKMASYRRKRFIILTGGGFMVGAMIGLSFLFLPPLFASAEPPAALLSTARAPAIVGERCTAVAVYDGDGPVWCEEGWKLRISGIAAREMDETCKPDHPCPAASGASARDALVEILGGATGSLSTGHRTIRPIALTCQMTGTSHDRRTAFCTLPDGTDLSCAMVASGTAVRWDKFWKRHRCPAG